MKTLLYNAGIMTMDARCRQFNHGGVLLEGDRISAIGPSEQLLAAVGAEVEQVDLRERWILPGLINTHVHSYPCHSCLYNG